MTELSIKIRIGNRDYPMKVKQEDEESIRKAGKILNEKIRYYQDQYRIDDNQDLLAMVAFDSMVEKIRNAASTDANEDFSLREVKRLNQLISDAI